MTATLACVRFHPACKMRRVAAAVQNPAWWLETLASLLLFTVVFFAGACLFEKRVFVHAVYQVVSRTVERIERFDALYADAHAGFFAAPPTGQPVKIKLELNWNFIVRLILVFGVWFATAWIDPIVVMFQLYPRSYSICLALWVSHVVSGLRGQKK